MVVVVVIDSGGCGGGGKSCCSGEGDEYGRQWLAVATVGCRVVVAAM